MYDGNVLAIKCPKFADQEKLTPAPAEVYRFSKF